MPPCRSNIGAGTEPKRVEKIPVATLVDAFFDLGGIAAGALKIPMRTFLFWCILGKIIKMLCFAYAGAYSINWVYKFMQ